MFLGLPKTRGTFLAVNRILIVIDWGLDWGSPYFGESTTSVEVKRGWRRGIYPTCLWLLVAAGYPYIQRLVQLQAATRCQTHTAPHLRFSLAGQGHVKPAGTHIKSWKYEC